MPKNKPKTIKSQKAKNSKPRRKGVGTTKPKTHFITEKISNSKQNVAIMPEMQAPNPAITEENKSTKPADVMVLSPFLKFLTNNWGTLANLVVTAIAFIVISIYLQNDQQDFEESLQEKIISLQSQANQAQLNIQENDYRLSDAPYYSFDVINNGPSSAENIKLAICLSGVDRVWKNEIDTMSDFTVSIDNPAVVFTMENQINECGVKEIANNLTLLSIDTLSPGQSVTINVKLTEDTALKEYLTNIDIELDGEQLVQTYEENQILFGNIMENSLQNYIIQNEFRIANFDVFGSCTNCVPEIEKKSFILSSLMRYTLNDPNYSNMANQYITIHIESYRLIPEQVNSLPSSYNWRLVAQPSSTNSSIFSLANIPVRKECEDAIDNDGDGKIDYPADPGCKNFKDPTE